MRCNLKPQLEYRDYCLKLLKKAELVSITHRKICIGCYIGSLLLGMDKCAEGIYLEQRENDLHKICYSGVAAKYEALMDDIKATKHEWSDFKQKQTKPSIRNLFNNNIRYKQ